jgi:hypothetical protein
MLYDSKGQAINVVATASGTQLTDRDKKKMVVELAEITQRLTQKDIRQWRRAWQTAIDVENPRRGQLLNVYTDVDIDGQITGATEQIKNTVLGRSFKVMDPKTKKEKPELTQTLEAKWFKDIIKLILDTRYWGHSLIQLGDVVTVAGKKKLTNIELVPREHVVPELGVILRDPSDELKSGIPYREGKISDWVLEVGSPKDLGLFLKLAPHAISKKNMLAFWDQFGELFGMPIRIGKTSSSNTRDNARLEKMLAEMGTAAYALFPLGTEIEIKESSRGDAYNVYDKRVERANGEMAKQILTVTMTMDNGSSKSQGEVHENMFNAVVDAQADQVKDVINNDLIPKLRALGFPFSENDIFDWAYAVDYTPEQQTNNEKMLLEHYEIDPAYFENKYGIKILGKKERQPAQFSTEKKKLS